MNNGNNKIVNESPVEFPRELTAQEKDYLFSVLPVNKPGYKIYRDKIKGLSVARYGNSGESSLILAQKDSGGNSFNSVSPVLAVGTIEFSDFEIDIIVHEEIDDEIEVEISKFNLLANSENSKELKRWSYSDWIPGGKAPGDNSEVREEILSPEEFILAIAPSHKKMWVYEFETGINHLIPISNYYNHLMLVKGIRNSSEVLRPALLFKNLSKFNSKEIVSAFFLYNKYMKHINLKYREQRIKPEKKKRTLKIFKRG